MGDLALGGTIFAPVTLIAGLFLLIADPVRAGSIEPPAPEPEDSPLTAVLYSVESGLLLLIPSDFELDDFEGDPIPSDLTLVDLDELTHGSADAFAITGICASDPVCNGKILGSGPGGRLSLADALLSAYGSDTESVEPPRPVPEPGTAALLGLGLSVLAIAGRCRPTAAPVTGR